jgi:truncated hemoglobin YjbI
MLSKEMFIEFLGGKETYEVLIISYCDRIHEDDNLAPFFGNFDAKDLASFEKDFLMAAFADPGSKDTPSCVHHRVTLHHHRLFEAGLDEMHFDMLKLHFLQALEDFFSDNDVVESCSTRLDGIRYIFEENGKRVKQSKIQQILDAAVLSETFRLRHEQLELSKSVPVRQTEDIVQERRSKLSVRSMSGEKILDMFRVNKNKKQKQIINDVACCGYELSSE